MADNSTLLQDESLPHWALKNVSSSAMLLSSRLRRHKSYVDPSTVMQLCRRTGSFLKTREAACAYVKETSSCTDIVQRINYLKLMVCDLGVGVDSYFQVFIMVVISLAIIAICTLFAYVVGKYFILPNIIYIASSLPVPSFESGLIMFAPMLAAPDLITNIAGCAKHSANGTLVLSGMMGRTLCCYAIGMAMIAFHQRKYLLPAERFTRSVLMILAGNVFTVSTLYFKLFNDNAPPNKQMILNIKYFASFLIMIYFSFIICVLLLTQRDEDEFRRSVPKKVILQFKQRNGGGLRLLAHALNPFKMLPRPRWCIGISAPSWFLAAPQVPVVDAKRPLNGWSKYLTCTSVLIFPWQLWMLMLPDFIFYAAIGVALLIALAFLIFTSANTPPRYHGLFALFGLIIGFSLLHVIDQEVNILLYQVLAFTANLHWGIQSTVAFSTCLVIFTIMFTKTLMDIHLINLASGFVLGIAVNQSLTALPSIIFQRCKDINTQVIVSAHTQTCFVFLVIILLASLFSAFVTKFRWYPAHGFFLLTFYSFFLIFTLCSGYDVIHPLGTYHSVSNIPVMEHANWA